MIIKQLRKDYYIAREGSIIAYGKTHKEAYLACWDKVLKHRAAKNNTKPV